MYPQWEQIHFIAFEVIWQDGNYNQYASDTLCQGQPLLSAPGHGKRSISFQKNYKLVYVKYGQWRSVSIISVRYASSCLFAVQWTIPPYSVFLCLPFLPLCFPTFFCLLRTATFCHFRYTLRLKCTHTLCCWYNLITYVVLVWKIFLFSLVVNSV